MIQYKVAPDMPLSRLFDISRQAPRTPNGTRNFTPALPAALALVALALASSAACDSTAKITPQELLFKDLRVVSAVPATQDPETNEWVRACGDDSGSGIIVNVALTSTQRARSGGSTDTDTSIRPGDVVNLRVVDGGLDDDIQVKQGTVVLDLSCVDSIPDSNLSSCSAASGAGVPLNSPNVTYEAYAGIDTSANLADQRDVARTTPHNVMLLIDQSGSMGGLVNLSTQPTNATACTDDDDCKDVGGTNPMTCFNDECAFTQCICGETCTCKEDDPGVVNQTVGGQQFIDYGSDYFNVRITAARSFIENLNARDKLGVLAFGEGISGEDMIVGCNDTFGVVEDDLDRCFGTNRDKVLSPGSGDTTDPLSALSPGSGRSNMWTATKVAYEFLRGKAASKPKETYHIIVLTDGPDTCSVSDEFGACQVPCSTVTDETIATMIGQDTADPNGPRIQLHFVQFESVGHVGRDPRQVDLACLSGGHYQFLNTVKGFASAQTGAFIEALEAALFNIRYSLMGNWNFAGAVPTWDLDAASGTSPGSMYAVSGQFTITDASKLQPEFDKQSFGVGKGVGAKDATQWDRRPTLLKPCNNDLSCGATDAAGEGSCTVICSSDTRLCPEGATGIDRSHGASCTTTDGVGGACCAGDCQTGICDQCP